MRPINLEPFKSTFGHVRGVIQDALINPLLQVPVLPVLILPLIARIGQYVHTGFIVESRSVPLLFWPGVDGEVALSMPVWLAMRAMLILYVAGILCLTWTTAHHGLLNGMSSMGMIFFAALIPLLLAWYRTKQRRSREHTGGNALPGRI